MTKVLTEDAISQFRERGYYFPVRVLSTSEARKYRQRLETSEADLGGTISSDYRHKVHLLFTWANELVRHPTVLDIAEDLLGSDVLCWTTDLFIKEPDATKYVSWHQDSTYWTLDPQELFTVWLALDDVPVESGALQYVPGSHRLDQVRHIETYAESNVLSRGQTVDLEIKKADIVDVPLRAGEASLHHALLVHGSQPNCSSQRRLGLAMRYIPAYAKRVNIADSAMLVRGTDKYGNFQLESQPNTDLDVAAKAAHKSAIELMRSTGYPGQKE